MKLFCMPSDFRTETIDKYEEINDAHSDSKVYETYGQVACATLFGTHSVNTGLPEVNISELGQYIQYSKDKGIKFNYILDSCCMVNYELTTRGYGKLKTFIKALFELGVDSVTVSLPSVIEITKYVAPDLEIVVSEINQIDTPSKAEFYQRLNVDRIILHQNIYRNFPLIRSIRKACKVDMCVIANSFCITNCPYQIFHNNSVSHTGTMPDKIYPYYVERCREQHSNAECFIKSNWIRPEDIEYYYDAGSTHFKLQGDTIVSFGEPVRAAEAYMNQAFNGDLVQLLELFSAKKPLSILGARINNIKLDGFINKFVEADICCTELCTECGYCKKYSKKAIKSQDAVLLDFMCVASEAMRGRLFHELEK